MAGKRTLLKRALINPLLPRQSGLSSYQKSRDQFIVSILLSAYLYIIYINLYNQVAIPETDPYHALNSLFSVIVVVGVSGAIILMRLTGRRTLVVNLFISTLTLALAAVVLQTGGVNSPAIPCAMLLPVIAITGIRGAAGVIWTIILCALAGLLFIADQNAINSQNIIEDDDFQLATFGGLLTANVLVVLVTIYNGISAGELHSQIEEQHNKYMHLAHHDSLTGIANRLHFINKIERAIFNAKLLGTPFSVLFFDLNSFKELNDKLGHHFGDLVLIAFAKCLREHTRANDVVARLGGDEFSILLLGLDDINVINQKIAIYSAALSAPMNIENTQYKISASIGYAIYPKDGDNYESLLKIADNGMYRVKRDSAAPPYSPI
jgi:diguanylate cyclase (GGDEF)-like protein